MAVLKVSELLPGSAEIFGEHANSGCRLTLYYQCSFHSSMSESANIRTAKLKSAGFVSSEFNDGRCTFADLLIDVKVVQLESVIVVRGDHDEPDSFTLFDVQ
jgi:hypothetical protein